MNDIYYQKCGEGKGAILLHGNPATHTLWRPLVDPLARFRSLHILDLPGFGRSAPPEDPSGYAVEKIADRVIELADKNELERFDLVGHSYGGAVAATIAAGAPDRIRSLVLITPVTPVAPPLGKLAERRTLSGTLSRLWRFTPHALRRGVATNGARVTYGSGYNQERAVEIARELDRPDVLNNMCTLMLQLDYAGLAESYRRIEQECDFPVLMVGAGHDGVVPFGQFMHLRERLSRACCTIYPECGHVPMWQVTDELAARVVEFWGVE